MNIQLFSGNNGTIHNSGQIVFNFNNSPDYQKLIKDLEYCQRSVNKYPDDLDFRQQLAEKEREMDNFKQHIEQMHKHFTQMYEQFCNEPLYQKRLNDAKQAFNDGDLAKVRFLLDEKELIAEQEYWLSQKDKVHNNLIINAQYWKLKALATAADFSLKKTNVYKVYVDILNKH